MCCDTQEVLRGSKAVLAIHRYSLKELFSFRILLIRELAFYGEVPERLNGAVSKTVVGATPPRVRIPASPPDSTS